MTFGFIITLNLFHEERSEKWKLLFSFSSMCLKSFRQIRSNKKTDNEKSCCAIATKKGSEYCRKCLDVNYRSLKLPDFLQI